MDALASDPVIAKMREDMNRLRGHLFELVEAVGFPPRQEEAIKRMIRRLTYDGQRDLESLLRGRSNGQP